MLVAVPRDVNINTINNQPDPFDSSQYFDLKNNTEHIPATIDFKEYKKDVTDGLEKIEGYEESIKKFYEATKVFLREIKPLDEQDLY